MSNARKFNRNFVEPSAALQSLVVDGPFSTLLTDKRLNVIQVAANWLSETGTTREDLLGHSVEELFPVDVVQIMRRSLDGKRTASPPFEIVVDGANRWFRLESGPWLDDQGEAGGLLVFGRDVTDLHSVRTLIERSERRLKMALEIDCALVWEKNLKTGELYVAGSLIDALPEFKATGDLLSLVHPDDRQHVEEVWERHLRQGAPCEIEFRHLDADKTGMWLRSVQTVVRGADGEAELLLGVCKDISRHRAAEAEIERLAFRDTLTGLGNRAMFQRRFNEAVDNAERLPGGIGLIILDVDHFKDINDAFGHDAGDALLRELGELMSRSFRKTDTVARLGGDEFAVILTDVNTPQAVLRPVQHLFDQLRTPVEHGGHTFKIGISVGAALFAEGQDPAQLLKNADIALYEAKCAGRNRVVLFQPAMRTNVEERIELLRGVRAGIQKDEFILYYQPVIDVQNQQVAGFEALMRWRHPEQGILLPARFMAAFEDQELSLRLGEIAFDRAMVQMRAWMDQGLDFGRVAVNVSPAQFRSNRLTEVVLDKLKHWGVPPDKLTIEVTENVYMGWSSDVVGSTIRDLHEAGVMIALDDFGTGYASLANLRQFPIDRLKIDGSFVQNPEDEAIVKAVIGLGNSMGMKVIAEGVERPDQLQSLQGFGCDQVQGYHFARPMPALEVPDFLRRFGARPEMKTSA